jgi:HSP20 family protein
MLNRFDPFQDFDWLNRPTLTARGYMAADVYRQDDRYFLEMDVPGVTQDQVDITVEKNTLTVAVERPQRTSDAELTMVRDRPFGSFNRRFYLGEGLDADGIEASLENGVLTLVIPIIEAAKARKIEVGAVRPAIEG